MKKLSEINISTSDYRNWSRGSFGYSEPSFGMPNSMKSRSAEAIRKSGRGFIFCRTRAGVERVADPSVDNTSIHGGMPQKKISVEDFIAEVMLHLDIKGVLV